MQRYDSNTAPETAALIMHRQPAFTVGYGAYRCSMSYSFVNKSADEIIRDLESNQLQTEIGGGAFEIAAAAIQAAVAREARQLQIRLSTLSLCLSAVSIVIAVIALVQ